MAHIEDSVLRARITEAETLVPVGSRYCHYKNEEHAYLITGFAILEANEEVGVLYKAEYGEHITYIRPLSSFLETVEKDGVQIPRFKKLEG